MRWIVGLDLLELSHGAIRFAKWIHRHHPDEEMFGVHSLGPQPQSFASADQSEEELRQWILGLAERSVADQGASSSFAGVAVVEATAPEDGLEHGLALKQASALIIGRKARRGEDPVVRLGRVARRLLRQMASPIAVVPPDLGEELPPGPVVLATDLEPSSDSALLFARDFAAMVGRDLLVVHAVSVQSALQVYVAASAWDRAHLEATERGQAAVSAYLDKHGISAQIEIVRGPIAFGILSACERAQACVLISGSRRLSFVDRIFNSSVGGELAALAAIPVIVVPPPEKG
jgi:nucleotide-binding universal stress UspA family protein